jgi:tetratricopeptide (TPR) repeat protein
MGRIEKTVFISYRRTNFWTALAVFQNLHSNGYDVFFDYKSIPSGDFEQAITENVKSRAHFIVILSPSALDRCNEPGDWLRQEIEIAIDSKRNIIPLMMEGFDFGSTAALQALTGKLADLKKYNALSIPAEYFEEAMTKLRSERFLNRPLESISHPISNVTSQITEEQKSAVFNAAPIEKEELTAQEWFERGYVYYINQDFDEAIRCFSEAIDLNPANPFAYLNRGSSKGKKEDYDEAIKDFTEAIRLNQEFSEAYYSRGLARSYKNDRTAIEDLTEAIGLKQDYADAYYARGVIYGKKDDYDKAIMDFDEAIHLKSNYVDAYFGRGIVHTKKGNYDGAIADFTDALRLKPDYADAYWGRGSARAAKEEYYLAIDDYQKYFDLGGKDATVLQNLNDARAKISK